ncbi:MAG: hypothetical protein HOI23_07585 [Deltaproteobacteria bacterium]|nr:hypothetical protein [Deltaproteobacteria bacterium]MBT6432152.1 hypothetical protein [Deltaproteobacteria bacterium]MBT6491924.1 hypothetical protein [Deltaproteobacteria bacterium]
MTLFVTCAALFLGAAVSEPMPVNADWDSVPETIQGDSRGILRVLAKKLGKTPIEISGVRITGNSLLTLAQTPLEESLVQNLRLMVRRPLKLDGLLYFVDDVLRLPESRRAREIVLSSSRARRLGVLLHPEEVFEDKVRVYPNEELEVHIDRPKVPRSYRPAKDGQILGPEWTARFPNPRGEQAKFVKLGQAVPGNDFHLRVAALLKQFRAQGAEVFVDSTVRAQERGYLIWGSYLLSQVESEKESNETLLELESARKEWELAVPIEWKHPKGWEAGAEAARVMAEAYGVTYATRQGAEASNHYDGLAVDITVVGLPAALTLNAPDGEKRVFDLSHPDHPRDLSLSPTVIAWIEEKYRVFKLKLDYPHWDDYRAIESEEDESEKDKAP